MRFAFLALFLASCATHAGATVVYVNASAPGALHDGKSWITAFTTIPTVGSAGTEVWVARGAYRCSYALGPRMSYFGGFAGTETARDQRDWVRNETVLDAKGGRLCFSTSSLSGRDTAVDGFTIRNVINHDASPLGAVVCYGATVLRHLTISGLDIWPVPAVIYVPKGGNPLIEDCVIASNTTDAVSCAPGSTAELRGCTLRDNNGYGLYAESSSITATGNTVSGADGTGLYCWRSTVALEGNTIQGNAGRGIGAFDCTGHITGNRIVANVDSGVVVSGSGILIANNLVADNRSFSGYTGGIYCGAGSPQIVNNTIVGNGGGPVSGGVYISSDYQTVDAAPLIANNIIAFNDGGVVNGYYPGAPALSHNCVFGNLQNDYIGWPDATGKEGNIKADPRLALPDYGNFHIQPGSPCIDAAEPAVASPYPDIDGQPRVLGTGPDIGADESDGTLWPSAPTIVRVSPDGSDANDGSSWRDTKRTVQAGLEALASPGGGEVWVAGGTYQETLRMGAYTRLLFYAARPLPASPRPVVDASGAGSALSIIGGARTVVDGFTFQNGRAVMGAGISIGPGSTTDIRNVTILNCAASSTSPDASSKGGGISVNGSTVTLRGCSIANCSAHLGGGLFAQMSAVSAERCSFTHNTATTENDSPGGGGGFYSAFGSLTLADCAVSGNVATGGGGGGTTHWTSGAPSSVTRCSFSDNSSGGTGGGLLMGFAGPDMRIADCLFARNTAASHGGGIYAPEFGGSIVNNTFTENHAALGGGIALLIGRVTLDNNILAFNSSGVDAGSEYAGGYYTSDPPWRGHFNCLYGNAGGDYTGPGSPLEGNGNLYADPLFANATAGNYLLQPASPCVDAGDSSDVLPAETDLNGHPRIQGRSVDIGAFESPFTASGPRWTDAWRALRLAAGLAASATADPNLDTDGSGRVDMRDVLAIVRSLSG